ncbi:related to nicotinamide mononucleotide permease [Cephalotrichum gorgonifer]|uniref:Related to nicotinamide mononucleotide permease n=1 Tax=Cephalotrichum gorgonifer TaxID=2041049 RepID=A0AAE8SW23_9PEZI|nr:related to nicotinamide mononucleotide permease [Cephalotrichum gorgonifer]
MALDARTDRASSEPSIPEKHDVVHIEGNDGAEEAEDPIEAKRVIRKIDLRLIPLLMFLYTLTFLDRVNIGNARLWNLERDLGMSGYDYNIVVLVFYIPYIILEIPSNIVLSRVQPRYWISFLTLGWGLSVTFAGFCKSFGGLLTARIFIGVFEAGMFPGCLFLIGSWYKRHELLTRMAWFMVSNDIAGSISGLLGAGLGSMDGTHGYSGWSWIFFIEGAVTCAAAALAFFFLPPFPDDATFLMPEEKEWVLRRLKTDNNQTGNDGKMSAKGAIRSLGDWKILTAGVLYLAVCVTAYSLSVFQPTILKTFGWSSLKSNLLSTPPRIASGIVSVCVGIWSDKVKRRGIFCVSGFTISIVGNLLVMLLTNGNLRYMGLYFASIGIYICQPLVIAWCSNQVVGSVKRGTLTAFAVSCGQLGGIISAVVYPSKDSPQYVPGISTCIAFQAVGILAAVNMWFWANRENKLREAGKRDHLRELPEEEFAKLGDKHPDFRYTL